MNKLLLFAAVIWCVGCSWNEHPEYQERKVYYQTYSEPDDSISVVNDAESVWFSNNTDGRLSQSWVNPGSDSVRCSLLIEGRLVVDGGCGVDISDTYVTVRNIIMRVWTDDKDSVMIFQPKINSRVAEPDYVFGWETLPEGLKYRRQLLVEEPAVITYKKCWSAEVEINYCLRVRETELAADCQVDYHRSLAKFESESSINTQMIVLVPLNLGTIKFDAGASEDNI